MTPTPSRDLLEHSFYQRWLQGTLTADELRDYAAQYAHVVRGLPGWLRSAARHQPGREAQLEGHAAEEDRHIVLWQRFAQVLGAEDADAPNAATAALLASAQDLSDGPAGVAVAWAIESQSPAVSREKLGGLARHYGIGADGAEYFRLHATLDVDHTAELEAMLAGLPIHVQPQAQSAADAVNEGLWNLLTSVERAE